MEFNPNDLKCNTTRTLIKKGLYEKDKQEVICPGCDKHILDIVTIDDTSVKLTHTIVCPCGEESFKYHTEGNYVYDHEDNIYAVDIEMDKNSVKLVMGKKQ